MSYRIELHVLAIKSFKKIPDNISRVIKKKISTLEEFSTSMNNIKALHGEYKGLYRLRVGDYRVLFEVKYNEKKIIILSVFPRGEGY